MPLQVLLKQSNRVVAWISTRPTFDNPYEMRFAKILDLLLLGFAASVMVLTVLVIGASLLIENPIFLDRSLQQRLVSGVITSGFILYLRRFLLNGHIKIVIRVLALTFIVFPTLVLYYTGQITNIAIIFYTISLVLSASFLHWYETIVLAILSCFCLFGIALLKSMALLPISRDYSLLNSFTGSILVFAILLSFLRFEIINREILKDTLAKLNRQVEETNRMNTQLSYSASHDPLTDLPNRRMMQDSIELVINQKNQNPDNNFALLFFDLDNFKFINDTQGHSAGDQVLIGFAQKLRLVTRGTDICGRLAGDEFVILLNNLDDYDEAVDVAKRVINELKTPFLIEGKSLSVTSSVGIVFSEQNYSTATEFLHAADIALYQAKENVRGTFAIFDESVSEQVTVKLELEKDLPTAITNHEISAYFQPIYKLDTLKLSGFELLTRWHHPVKGIISPNTYIPIAEESGAILELDIRMLEQACQQFLLWKAAGLISEDTCLSANVSPRCLEDLNYVGMIAKLLATLKFDPNNLCLEITEGSLIKNFDKVLVSLRALKAKGIKISIDDFGTGFSSLNSLHQLPIDVIKVDRSFVTTLNNNTKNQHIIETIVTLAKSLNMQIVAEGIEDIRQLDHLRSLDSDFGQGYYFTEPLNIEDTEAYLKSLIIQSNSYMATSDYVVDRTKN